MVRSAAIVVLALSAAAGLPAGAGAKPARPVRRPATVPRAETPPAPTASAGDVGATGLMTPKEVKLRPTTPAEAEANAVWSTRAGLNIAALQCQFSPFLAAVRNYNDFLRQHADELDRARADNDRALQAL